MQSTNSAHARTTAREQALDITASGINSIPIIPPTMTRQKLSSILPPLIFGTATFTYQFNTDPYALNPTNIVHAALTSGIRAFDTSPYYGPAEAILGSALTSPQITLDPATSIPRSNYFILTKAGRIRGNEFDYSRDWIRFSVARSCARLHTTYLDVVYLHDVEFVSPSEVLTGIKALRELRDEGLVRYVGICGYPLDVLAELAEMVLTETGEGLDIVQSYANFTVQSTRLAGFVERFKAAGVDVVPNASPLGMGLCRGSGPPVGAMGKWHPAPDELKEKMGSAATFVAPEKLETLAVRFAMEEWMDVGAKVGSEGPVPSEAVRLVEAETAEMIPREKIGVSVMGVSKVSELMETMNVYTSILAARQTPDGVRMKQGNLVKHIREDILTEWADFAWDSPDQGFANTRKVFGVSPEEQAEYDELVAVKKIETVTEAKGDVQVGVQEILLPVST